MLDRPGERTIELGFVIFVFGILTERLSKPVICPCIVLADREFVLMWAMFMLALAGPDLMMVAWLSPTAVLGILLGWPETDMVAVTGPLLPACIPLKDGAPVICTFTGRLLVPEVASI